MFQILVVSFALVGWASALHLAWFLTVPARESERRIEILFRFNRCGLSVATCREKLARIRRSPLKAFVLDYLGSPAAGYAYLGRPWLSLLSFITLGGLGVWWLISLFTLPYNAIARNECAADVIARGGTPETLLQRASRRLHNVLSQAAHSGERAYDKPEWVR